MAEASKQHRGQEGSAQAAQRSWAQFNGGIELNSDILACLLLSEAVYKAAEGPPTYAVAALNLLLADLRAALPPGAPTPQLSAVQFSRRGAQHRYLIARGTDALYLSFMGSKQPRDLLSDANVVTALLWGAERAAEAAEAASEPAAGATAAASELAAAAVTGAAAAAAAAAAAPEVAGAASVGAPAAHRGFLWRSQGVPVEALFMHARQQGLRLVLCGHSMGGAVAQLCTLRLLRALHSQPPASELRCIVFGAPPIGNAALASHVQRLGWGPHFTSIALPEDPVPRLLLQAASSQQGQRPRPQQAPPSGAAGEPAVPPNGWELEEAGEKGAEQGLQPISGSTAEALRDSLPGEDTSTPPAATATWRPAAAAAAALARRPLRVAGGVARTAARGALAGASMLRPSAVLPAFCHIGELFLLLPGGLVPAAGSLTATQPGPGSNPAPTAQAAQAQQWRQLHSMVHYRARAAALCWHQVRQDQQGRQQQGQPGELEQPESGLAPPPLEADPASAVALSRSLAPAVLVCHAVARLPVVQPSPAQPQRQVVQLTVEVQGGGLECCTGATLRLPGTAAPLAAAAVTNLAKQQLMAGLRASAGSSALGSGGAADRGGWLQAAVERGWSGVHHWRQALQPPAAAPNEPPGIVLRFSVPAAAILALQLQQQEWLPRGDAAAEAQHEGGAARLLPPARLVLLNDFGRAAASVWLQPRVVWVLGLDGTLAADTWDGLGVAAAAGSPPEARPASSWRQRLPAVVAGAAAGSVPGGTEPGSSTEAPATGGAAAGPAQHRDQHQQAEQEQADGRAGSPPRFATPAVQRLRRLGEQLAAHLPGHSAAEQGPGLPAALLRGMLLLHATAALAGSSADGVEGQLEAAIEALQWLAKQQPSTAAGGGASSAAASAPGGLEPEVEEVEDEYLAELRQLGLAARLRRQLAQAARVAAAKRRALGAARRRATALLCAAPPPDALLLVLHHRDLLSTQFGEGLDEAALGAVRRLAVACRACRPAGAEAGGSGPPVPLLLAVASSSALSAPYRYELAAATGLADHGEGGTASGSGSSSRYGSVVPLPLQGRQPGPGVGSGSSAGGAGRPGWAGDSAPQVSALLAALLHYVGQSSPAPGSRL